MVEQKSAQCIIQDINDDTMYCFFNTKYNKYAPVGGKYESHDTCGKAALMREVNEELEIGGVSKIVHTGIHVLEAIQENTRHTVELYVLYVDGVLLPKEDFLKLVKVSEIPKEKLNKSNSYTSLLSILRSIEDGFKWRWDFETL